MRAARFSCVTTCEMSSSQDGGSVAVDRGQRLRIQLDGVLKRVAMISWIEFGRGGPPGRCGGRVPQYGSS